MGRLARDWHGRYVFTSVSIFQESPRVRARLGLKSEAEWREYCKSGKKPADIPADPRRVYAEDGWTGMGDWLGTGRVAAPQRRELEARTVV